MNILMLNKVYNPDLGKYHQRIATNLYTVLEGLDDRMQRMHLFRVIEMSWQVIWMR